MLNYKDDSIESAKEAILKLGGKRYPDYNGKITHIIVKRNNDESRG